MKKCTIIALLLTVSVLSACGSNANTHASVAADTNKANITSETNKKTTKTINKAEIIDENNRSLIGTIEVLENSEPQNESSVKSTRVSIPFPKSLLVRELASKDIVGPSSITEFKSTNGVTPEIIMTNGSCAVFYNNDSQGWTCKKGDVFSFKFEEYPSKAKLSQPITIGYILDGKLYQGEDFRTIKGEYQLKIKKSGDYYCYVISATSDYLALKNGTIFLNKQTTQ